MPEPTPTPTPRPSPAPTRAIFARLTGPQRRALDISRSVAVTAGAGSGKTTVLAARYLWLLEAHRTGQGFGLAPDEILAITYTRKAAAEMRGRILGLLRGFAAGDPAWEPVAERAEASAPIETIHSFCASLLREHAVAAGVDPAFEVLTAGESALVLRDALRTVLDELAAAADPDLETLARRFSRRDLTDALRGLAARRTPARAWARATARAAPEEVLGRIEGYGPFAGRRLLADGRLRGAIARLARVGDGAAPLAPDDAAFRLAAAAVPLAARLASERTTEREARAAIRGFAFEHLCNRDGKLREPSRLGTRKAWLGRDADLDLVREGAAALCEALERVEELPGEVDALAVPYLQALARVFLRFDARHEGLRRERAALDFDDLLERALDFLRGPAGEEALGRLRRRHRYLLVDEYQDVDPLQGEIVDLLAREGATGELADGRLFAVGDEKQSIYRFRGADVSVFVRLRRRIEERNRALATDARRVRVPPEPWGDAPTEPAPHGVASLDESFRTLERPLAFVNAVFDRIFGPRADGRPREDFEAEPGPLRGRRGAPGGEPGRVELLLHVDEGAAAGHAGGGAGGNGHGNGHGPGAWPLDPPAGEAGDEDEPQAPLEDALPFGDAVVEADLVARLVRARLDDPGFLVLSRDGTAPGRPVRPGDVAILLRRRTNLKLYETALRRHGVPFVVHGGAGLYAAPEVLDLANLVSFLADPRDDAALAGLLRSPFASLSDSGLVLVARLRGETLEARLRAAAGGDVAGLSSEDAQAVRVFEMALARLRGLADRLPLAELLRAALEDTGALAAYAVGARGAQALANIEKVLGVARGFEERGFRGLGDLGTLLELLIEEEAVEAEAAPAGTGDDAVRILTVHGAKGLEFPVVVVPELAAPPRRDAPPALLELAPTADGVERPEVGLRLPDPARGHKVHGTGLRRTLYRRAEAKEQAEARRLLYVACTRARDRLLLVGSVRSKDGRIAARNKGSWLEWLLESVPVDGEALEAGEARAGDVPVALVRPEDLPPRAPAAGERPLVETWSGAAQAAALAAGSAADAARLVARLPGLAPIAAPARRPRLSPSSWATLRQCGHMYRLRHLLLVPEAPPYRLSAAPSGARAGSPDPDVRAKLRGSVIHRLLEEGRRADDLFLEDEVARAIAAEGADPGAPGLVASIGADARRALVAFARSALALEVARADEVRREQPFAVDLRPGTIEGTIDVLFRAGREWRVVDYKSNDIPSEAVATEVEAYRYDLQVGLYALAVSRLFKQPSVRATLFFTGPAVAHEEVFDEARLERVREEAERDIARLAAGALDRPEVAPCATCSYAASGACDRADPGLFRPLPALPAALCG